MWSGRNSINNEGLTDSQVFKEIINSNILEVYWYLAMIIRVSNSILSIRLY